MDYNKFKAEERQVNNQNFTNLTRASGETVDHFKVRARDEAAKLQNPAPTPAPTASYDWNIESLVGLLVLGVLAAILIPCISMFQQDWKLTTALFVTSIFVFWRVTKIRSWWVKFPLMLLTFLAFLMGQTGLSQYLRHKNPAQTKVEKVAHSKKISHKKAVEQ